MLVTMVVYRSILVLPAVIALAGHHADAFAPASLACRNNNHATVDQQTTSFASSPVARSMSSATATKMAMEYDVSVEYDAAARLAYKEWCAKFGKEPSEERFGTFKANYETIAVANVVAAKEARDNETERPQDLELNEFGDMTEAEYMAMQSGGSARAAAAPEKGALGSVLEASAAQSEASTALAEAADALALEEEKLAKELGMGSIAELEEAIDAMEGFDTDGGAIDTSDVREARVRSAYLNWCKEYERKPDEARFPTFSSNFLAMEEYAEENNREMVLNKYADCTEEEYRKLTEVPAPVIEEAKVKPVIEKAPKVEVKEPEKVVAEEKVVEKAVLPPPAPVVEAKAKPVPKPKPEPVVELSLEEQAIADAKAMAEREAAQVAKRRARDEAAAAMERQKAKDALERQQKLMPRIEREVTKSAPAKTGIFSAIFGSSSETKVEPAKPVKETKAPVKPVAVTKVKKAPEKKQDIFASIFRSSAAKPATMKAAPVKPVVEIKAPLKPAAPITPPAAVKVEKKMEAKNDIFASLFGSVPAKTVAKKESVQPPAPVVKPAMAEVKKVEAKASSLFAFFQPAAKPAPQPKPTPSVPEPRKPAPVEITIAPNAISETLNSFFGTKPAAKKALPPPPPEPKVVEKKPLPKPEPFSFFKPAAPKPEPISKQIPIPASKTSPTLTLLNAKKTATAPPKAQVPKSAPVSARKASPTLSLFNNAKRTTTPPPKQSVQGSGTKSVQGSGTFSIFSGPKPATPAPKAAPVVVEKKKVAERSGTFSLFSAPKVVDAPKVVVPVVAKKAVAKKTSPSSRGGFFGGSAAPKGAVPKNTATPVADDIPIISKFRQNADGSITGSVRNSKSFRSGTEITTSAVARGAKAGSVVITSSGSKYRLE